jgi:transposase-like protein
MAQGKAFTKEQRAEIIQSLQASLELGYSRNKACEFIGLSPQTLSNWVKEDEALGMKLQSWESAIDTMVLANIRDAIRREGELQDDLKKENSWQWAKRKMKEQGFSERTEVTGNDGEPIVFVLNDMY